MEKTLKINVPSGYEICKEMSTSDNVIFKKIDDVIIKWNDVYKGVEIKEDGEHFVVHANKPSYCCSWDDAMRYCQKNGLDWKLPTVKQLQKLAKYIDKVNVIICDNNGFEISGWMWSCEEKDEFHTWGVSMYNGHPDTTDKFAKLYMRTIYTL